MNSTKIMFLGIALMLVAIYIPHEAAFRTGGSEIFLLGLGFIIVIVGLLKNISKYSVRYFIRLIKNGPPYEWKSIFLTNQQHQFSTPACPHNVSSVPYEQNRRHPVQKFDRHGLSHFQSEDIHAAGPRYPRPVPRYSRATRHFQLLAARARRRSDRRFCHRVGLLERWYLPFHRLP